MTERLPTDAQWPQELARLQADLARTSDPEARERLRGEFWRLLYAALHRQLRFHARNSWSVEPADLEDISSEKALELLKRAETGAWSLAGRTASEISGYVSAAARYGWIDHVERGSRQAPIVSDEQLDSDPGPKTLGAHSEIFERPAALDLVAALRGCLESLPERNRRVWFFRVFYAMSGRDIARHPRVRLNAPHVDVLVQRARDALRECLHRKGQSTDQIPSGAFVELWELFESLALREPAATEERGTGGDTDEP